MRSPYECRHGFARGKCLAPCCESYYENFPKLELTIEAILDRAHSARDPQARIAREKAVTVLGSKLPSDVAINLRDRELWHTAMLDAVHDGDLARSTATRYLHIVWSLLH